MASSSSNSPPSSEMVASDDPQNHTADIKIIGTRTNDAPFPLLDWEWMLRGKEVMADKAWIPPLSNISDLKIQKGNKQPVPIDFEFPCSTSTYWTHWMGGALLHIPSFFSWGEFTITLEDVENHWMLPVLGDMDPYVIEMSNEEIRVEQELKDRSSTRIDAWPLYFARGTNNSIHCAAFIAYWLWVKHLTIGVSLFLRMVILCGGRLGICTMAMLQYWLRVAIAMTAVSYADRQNLGFMEWDEPRGGWILYSTKFPSVKTPSKRPKVAMNRSMASRSELGNRSPIAPGASKKSAVETSKAQKKLDVESSEAQEESAVDPPILPKETVEVSSIVQKKYTTPPTKTASKSKESQSKNVVASKKSKGKSVEKSTVSPSSPGKESVVVRSAIPVKKGSAILVPSGTVNNRTRSKRKAAVEQAKPKIGGETEGSDGTPIVIEVVSSSSGGEITSVPYTSENGVKPVAIFGDPRSTIITNDLVRDAKPCDDVFTDEVGHGCSNGLMKWDGLNPFCEVLCNY
uniref:Aminotransferase-like plant mobile domain-containing protein n=1 Tax=Fagus sylvatica TaxID=28930 RepID=A0A2N9HSJ8_FAGSY